MKTLIHSHGFMTHSTPLLHSLLEFISTEEERLIEFSCDNSLNAKFRSMEFTKFWFSIKDVYPSK